ncbi:trypsin-like serine peptidase [Xylella fastidiosa]|uniref:Serine protease n=1 Tax=Xylella fastidiosa subsp. multiplex TaxID=644357 RepID=A0AAW6HXZ9_XYLFS|nr:hypothetical protein [Xylella fastidiosa]MBS9446460.1 hypothetical protein [Xylella fastidiosa subsp. multiplex]MBS9448466.1 hypothetical protein [Xylella fastidiosa subsp. multiplex]MBS9450489.1 hypothetical protein [Xylella fastidiosa subsp. multiplex]MBS9452460.1 hypothetical protein [Xylella fastidiosa subsp. multiplex]MBS9486810.1 hypothetical protein [Xylella fastidiosa subsp. multiplex]
MNKSILIFVPLILSIPFAFANSRGDNQDSENNSYNDAPHSVAEMEAAENYWTEDRIRAAKPIPIPRISQDELSRIEAETKFRSSLPSNKKQKSIVIEASPYVNEEHWDNSLPGMKTTAGVPEEADVNHRPFWNAGKLYFTDPDSHEDYECTAEFVTSNRVLMTAGHCLMNSNGHWNTNIVFAPRFRGKERFKKSGTSCKAVPNGLINKYSDYNHSKDYGFIVAYREGPGWLGLKTNIPYNNWTAIGYPENYSDGKYLQRVDGSKGSTDTTVEMKNNPMEHGSSGGAWIGELNTTQVRGNYAIGLNSFHVNNAIMFSPYFDNNILNILNKVKSDCNIK